MLRIPVRYTLEFGPKLHWQKGELVGVNGTKVFIHPRTTHHGGKIEPTDPDKVHLWTSQMDKKLLALANALRKTMADEAAAVAEAARKAAADAEANEAAKALAMAASPLEPPPIIDVGRFASEFTTYLSLKKTLLPKAATEGIGYLTRLRSDYFAAMELAELAKGDMAELVPELESMGVQIPDDLVMGILKQPPEPPKVEAVEPIGHVTETLPQRSSVKVSQLNQVHPKPSKAWSTGIARQYESAILKFMKSKAGQMLRGADIIDACGISCSSASTVLAPIVHKGLIQQYGERATTRYRVNVDPPQRSVKR